jgi:hypothetical protein
VGQAVRIYVGRAECMCGGGVDLYQLDVIVKLMCLVVFVLNVCRVENVVSHVVAYKC